MGEDDTFKERPTQYQIEYDQGRPFLQSARDLVLPGSAQQAKETAQDPGMNSRAPLSRTAEDDDSFSDAQAYEFNSKDKSGPREADGLGEQRTAPPAPDLTMDAISEAQELAESRESLLSRHRIGASSHRKRQGQP